METLNGNGRAVYTSTQEGGYTTMFGTQNNPLPAVMEISRLIDWEQINTNSAGMTKSQIENQLSDWIKVSYEVWSITPTSLKSRDLKRVYASGDQYYEGLSTFAFEEKNALYHHVLIQEAKTQAEGIPGGYNFSDDAGFGNTYHLFHTQYDTGGDAFYPAMNAYCTALNAAQNPAPKNAEEAQDIKGGEVVVEEETPVAEELTVAQPGLTVYPNPAQHEVNFRLVSQEVGQAGITLYDLQGRALISTTDYLNGRDILQGHINIAPLPTGIYVLEVKLPKGKSITKKIVKQ